MRQRHTLLGLLLVALSFLSLSHAQGDVCSSGLVSDPGAAHSGGSPQDLAAYLDGGIFAAGSGVDVRDCLRNAVEAVCTGEQPSGFLVFSNDTDLTANPATFNGSNCLYSTGCSPVLSTATATVGGIPVQVEQFICNYPTTASSPTSQSPPLRTPRPLPRRPSLRPQSPPSRHTPGPPPSPPPPRRECLGGVQYRGECNCPGDSKCLFRPKCGALPWVCTCLREFSRGAVRDIKGSLIKCGRKN